MNPKATTVIEVGATLANISFSIANLNALLTTVLLVGNIGYLAWRWNRQKNQPRNKEDKE